ncbi:AAA family ATPase [candidate division KSB1 bacterium]|nr:AAA family ATPase [candidate division KSB1 bacterium]MBL7094527.1 AAA family ATPase [candidate division KSB1 bacterium]
MSEKFLPLGVQDFETMQTSNFIYVDKTEYIYQLIRPSQAYYFLSRPRRFGKSLLVSTLGYLFQGRKDLFEGLWIDKNTDWQWKKFPVVKIDFDRISHENPEQLKKGLLQTIKESADDNEIKIKFKSELLLENFCVLITELKKKNKSHVVVLIDEYDKPVITHLGKGKEELETAKQNHDMLMQFLGVLKAHDISSALRLVFITGVSKLSWGNMFSGLNNLNDLSWQSKFASFLGYTKNELENNFGNNISKLSRYLDINYEECLLKLQSWYNGYRFTDSQEKVCNPFSILNVFQDQEFKNYWFETGASSFLKNLIRENDFPIPENESLQLTDDIFSTYEPENLHLEAFLFQTGHITITDCDDIFFHLNYPNQEVKTSFLKYIK